VQVLGAVADVPLGEAVGDQKFDRLADQLLPLVAEHRLGLGVGPADDAPLVHHHDGVGGELEQPVEDLLRFGLGRRAISNRGLDPAVIRHGEPSLYHALCGRLLL
jgi:hypothetical protein